MTDGKKQENGGWTAIERFGVVVGVLAGFGDIAVAAALGRPASTVLLGALVLGVGVLVSLELIGRDRRRLKLVLGFWGLSWPAQSRSAWSRPRVTSRSRTS
jgi:hypothetical protein